MRALPTWGGQGQGVGPLHGRLAAGLRDRRRQLHHVLGVRPAPDGTHDLLAPVVARLIAGIIPPNPVVVGAPGSLPLVVRRPGAHHPSGGATPPCRTDHPRRRRRAIGGPGDDRSRPLRRRPRGRRGTRVDGELWDLDRVLPDGAVVEPVRIDRPDGLMVLRHSTAHVLAQAVQQVNPDAKLGIGPPIRDGFYYDFDVEAIHPEDPEETLDKVMQKIINEGQTGHRREVSDGEALRGWPVSPTGARTRRAEVQRRDAGEGVAAEVGEVA